MKEIMMFDLKKTYLKAAITSWLNQVQWFNFCEVKSTGSFSGKSLLTGHFFPRTAEQV